MDNSKGRGLGWTHNKKVTKEGLLATWKIHLWIFMNIWIFIQWCSHFPYWKLRISPKPCHSIIIKKKSNNPLPSWKNLHLYIPNCKFQSYQNFLSRFTNMLVCDSKNICAILWSKSTTWSCQNPALRQAVPDMRKSLQLSLSYVIIKFKCTYLRRTL